MWYNLAAASGGGDYKSFLLSYVERRDSIAEKMSPTQIAEAQRLARGWKPKNPGKKPQ
jgi:hypothetical protein